MAGAGMVVLVIGSRRSGADEFTQLAVRHGGCTEIAVPDVSAWTAHLPFIKGAGHVIVNGFPKTREQAECVVRSLPLGIDHPVNLLELIPDKEGYLELAIACGVHDIARDWQHAKPFFDQIAPAIKVLKASGSVIIHKPVSVIHPGLSEEERLKRIVRRCWGLVGLPTAQFSE